jgi:DNA-binding MarR family transcriptional regulator
MAERDVPREGEPAPAADTTPRGAAGTGTAGAAPGTTAAEIAAAWRRERPGTPTTSIEIVTPVWRLAKLFADDRNRALRRAGIDAATLDLLSVLRRAGSPYALSTRELARRTLLTAGAISQRVARAERDGLVRRTPGAAHRSVLVELTPAGQALIERSVDAVLAREATLVADLTDDERTLLIGLLERLLVNVRERVGR